MPKNRTCANTPALPRRCFLIGAATVPLTLAQSTAASPVAQAFYQWHHLYAWINSEQSAALSEPKFEYLCSELYQLEEQALAKPSESAQDILLKVAVQTNFGAYVSSAEPNSYNCWSEFEEFIG